MKRRDFLTHSALAGFASLTSDAWGRELQENFFPIHAITRGPRSHWFGYYDKAQVDPSGRYVLGMEVDIPMRSPTEKDIIRIGMVDLKDNARWISLGESNAWGWQQGCMLQWRPGSSEEIIWNDEQDGQFVCHILNVKTGRQRTLSKAIYALTPDGKFAIGTEFNRIQNMRPGYGYPGIDDPYADVKVPKDIGIYRLDLDSGESKLLISLADVAQIPYQGKSLMDNWHYFNHLLVSPDSERFIFLHRWRQEMGDRAKRATGGFTTRMFTSDKEGNDLHVVDPSGYTSHFIWRDPKHICAWTKPENHPHGFYLFEDKTPNFHIVGKDKMTVNGHNTYVPQTNNEWILNDTYPDKERMQTLYLYHVPTDTKVVLGRFYEPPEFRGEWRCDLHPRCNQQGTQVIFDSMHEGNGRQMYVVDIAKIVKS